MKVIAASKLFAVHNAIRHCGYTFVSLSVGNASSQGVSVIYQCPRGHNTTKKLLNCLRLIGSKYVETKQGITCGTCREHERRKEIQHCCDVNGYTLVDIIPSDNRLKVTYKCGNGHVSNVRWKGSKWGFTCNSCYNSRITYLQVKEYFLRHGCKLLSTEYVDARSKLRYICNCGKENHICWNDFQQGRRCYECGRKSTILAKCLAFADVAKLVSERGGKLLRFDRTRRTMQYICPCGRGCGSTTLYAFLVGSRCKICAGEQLAQLHRMDVKEAAKIVAVAGCQLFPALFRGSGNELVFYCRCGRTGKKSSLRAFIQHPQCSDCGTSIRIKNRKDTLEFYEKQFQKIDLFAELGRVLKSV